MRLFYSPDRPQTDTVVTLNANIMSSSGEPLQQGHVTVQTISPAGTSESLRLQPRDDEWGLFTGSFTPTERGEYRMILTCRENDSTLETKLAVQGVDRERLGQPARLDVLQEIARISRGKIVNRDEMGGLLAEIQALPEPEPLVRIGMPDVMISIRRRLQLVRSAAEGLHSLAHVGIIAKAG